MQIDCVTSGWEAVEAVYNEKVKYNAIFMDHMMPGIDGIEATRLIREIGTDYAKNVPIIALTANAIVGNEEIFLNKGFQAFVSKPIEISRLDAVIREFIRDREQEKLYIKQDEQDAGDDHAGSDIDIEAYSSDIYGLNTGKGIRRFSGDTDAYISVLSSYTVNTPPLLDAALKAGSDRTRLSEYETVVHGIKGSSGGICADKVAELASTLEEAAKSGDYDYITVNNTVFVDTARNLITDLEVMLEKIRSESSRPKKDKPDEATLEKLREACTGYEMNIVDEAIAELEAYDYETDSELVAWLRINAEQTNFDEIVERLSARAVGNSK